MTTIPPGAWALDPDACSVTVRASHVGGAAPAEIRFPVLAGHGELADGATAEVHVSAVDARSGMRMRDAVLATGLWLGVNKHPEIVATVESFDGTTATGTLTAKGRTRPLTATVADVEVAGDDLRATVTATVDFRAYGIGTPGLVKPEVAVTMALVARRR